VKFLQIAIVGCGLIGDKRAAAAKALGHTIVQAADVDRDRAAALVSRHGGMAVDRWRDLMSGPADLVVVATSHDSLADVALAALNAGKHVLIEKPGGRSAAELDAITHLAKARNLVAKVGFNHRFHPAFVRAKELIASGDLGPVMFIRGAYGHGGRPGYEKEWRFRRAISGGGQLIDQGAHLIDLSRWIMGDVTRATGLLRTYFWDSDVEDNCFVSLEGATGAVAWLHAGWTEWKNRFSFEIMCRDAKLEISGLGGSYGTEKLTFYRMLPGMGPPETISWEYPFPDRSWQAEIENVTAAIERRAAVNGSSDDAARMLDIVESLYAEGATVRGSAGPA
jgi:predicted dehydrogenase